MKSSQDLGKSCPSCGDPINPGTGNKYEVATDYTGVAPMPLVFERTYNSLAVENILAPFRMGPNWRHTFSRAIVFLSSVNAAQVPRPDGKTFTFQLVSGIWQGNPDNPDTLVQFIDGSGNVTGWKYTVAADDSVETYDANGKLIAITNRAGLTQTLAYDAQQRLTTVTDPFGRTLAFSYDTLSRITSVTDPAGGVFQYAYDGFINLTSVTYPDGKTRSYLYENPSFPNSLTGILDENGIRFASFTYDAQNRATSSQQAGGADKDTLTYGTSTTTSVDALNATRTYNFQDLVSRTKNTAITGDPCPTCGPAADSYDANGYIASITDYNGNVTTYVHDTRGLETSRTEASGTPQSRTITTSYHPTFHLPTQVNEPGRTTNLSYDASGNLLTKSITDTGSGRVRTFTYTYNANGQVLALDGPRSDVNDVTTYTYYPNNDSDHGRAGQLASVTNALGQVTNITAYNAHGQPLSITDPNGLLTTLSYDTRLRLTSRNVGGETTTYTYDAVGQLTQVTLPDGSFLNYTYDAAHRLTQIADNLGNRIAYTLDAMGNRTKEDVFDPLNAHAQTRSRVYSNLNRLAQEIGAQAQTTTYAYDNQGNFTSIDGPLAGTVDVTTNSYDALNRLVRVTDPNAGQVNYGYNALDQLTSVSDPRTLVTSYSYDGLNNLNQQASPDTGTTVNTYDAAGNLLTQTDAKGQLTTYTYDALNRVTSIVFQGGVTHTYQYDQGANGLGRLTQITEPASTTQYAYDQKGRLVAETRIINAVSYVTSYSYDAFGRMTGMTYPSGRQVTYTLDSLGRIQQIATTKDATTQTVVSSVAYRPFGPALGFTFGNGQTYTRGFDQDGRIASYTLAVQSFAVGYDAASRIGFLSDIGNPANSNTYSYDNLDRLTNAVLPGTPFAYSYDAVGNRLAKTVGSSTDIYAYSATSNRLASITPGAGPLRNYVHDATGSVTADGANSYAYDTRGRLTQAVSVVGTSNYQINSLGQRIRKTNTQGDTLYHYDSQGRLIAESSASGTLQKEYIYLGDIPVAVIQ